LALYHELTHRHLHTIIRPNVHDRIDGWHVYRTLFDILVEEFSPDLREDEETEEKLTHSAPPLYILPEWAFDILHEFVYQFQGFCQFRIGTMALAKKHALVQSAVTSTISNDEESEPTAVDESSAVTYKKQPSAHLIETLRVLNENKDAWAVESVFYYLQRLIYLGTDRNPSLSKKKRMSAAMQYLGVFASVTLSRMECLLGDHTAAIAAVTPLMVSSTHPSFYGMIYPPQTGPVTSSTSVGGAIDDVVNPNMMVTLKSSTPDDIISSVLAARVSMSYHAGVSFLMLRRYKDAIRILSSMCAFMQRGLFKSVGYVPTTVTSQQQGQLGTSSPTSSLLPSATGAYRKYLLAGFDQNVKMYDRMLALLAILHHICPVSPTLIDDGVLRILLDRHGHQLAKMESGEEVLEDFFMAACPKFVLATVPDYDSAFSSTPITYAAQDAIQAQVKHFVKEVSSASSNRKLRSYMKLYTSISVEKLSRLMSEDSLPSLLGYKYKLYQTEAQDHPSTELVMDIHFFIHQNIIHVEEEEKRTSFESYFLEKITENGEIMKDLNLVGN
jgi:translation initiation factor 3 subunit L